MASQTCLYNQNLATHFYKLIPAHPINVHVLYLLKRFSIVCRQAKVITLANHNRRSQRNRELTNRRLFHDDAVRLRDISTEHAHLGTCRRRDKVDDVGVSDLTASWKQQDARLFFKVFSRCFRCFCQIFQVSP